MIDFENDYNEGLSKWCDGVICEVPAAQNNILNGMDSSTGIFTVPVSATYSFYFTGTVMYNGNDQVLLRVHQVDGLETKTIDLYDGNFGGWNVYYPVNYEWTMTLNQGNEIYLKLAQNNLIEESEESTDNEDYTDNGQDVNPMKYKGSFAYDPQ